jgi:hypothetical protein
LNHMYPPPLSPSLLRKEGEAIGLQSHSPLPCNAGKGANPELSEGWGMGTCNTKKSISFAVNFH